MVHSLIQLPPSPVWIQIYTYIQYGDCIKRASHWASSCRALKNKRRANWCHNRLAAVGFDKLNASHRDCCSSLGGIQQQGGKCRWMPGVSYPAVPPLVESTIPRIPYTLCVSATILLSGGGPVGGGLMDPPDAPLSGHLNDVFSCIGAPRLIRKRKTK